MSQSVHMTVQDQGHRSDTMIIIHMNQKVSLLHAQNNRTFSIYFPFTPLAFYGSILIDALMICYVHTLVDRHMCHLGGLSLIL